MQAQARAERRSQQGLAAPCLQEIVGESFNSYDRAIVLPPGVRNDALISAINEAVLKLHYQGGQSCSALAPCSLHIQAAMLELNELVRFALLLMHSPGCTAAGEDGRIALRYWPPRDQEVCPAYQESSHITLSQVRRMQECAAWRYCCAAVKRPFQQPLPVRLG